MVKKCSLFILEDPLDQFDEVEANRIIDYLFDENHPWTLIVVGTNERWRKNCDHVIELENGRIKSDVNNA
jgi:predicted ABC-type transport system involved in lysophospholipase L1 biosynthesis ATPase subunit